MVLVCHGAIGRIEDATKGFSDVFGLIRRKNNQIEQFVMRRVSFKRTCITNVDIKVPLQ